MFPYSPHGQPASDSDPKTTELELHQSEQGSLGRQTCCGVV